MGLVKLPVLCTIWNPNATADDPSCGCCREWLSGVVKGGEAEQAAWSVWAAGFLEPVRSKILLSTARCIWDCWLFLQQRQQPLRQQGSEKYEGWQWHEATQPVHLHGWREEWRGRGDGVSLWMLARQFTFIFTKDRGIEKKGHKLYAKAWQKCFRVGN